MLFHQKYMNSCGHTEINVHTKRVYFEIVVQSKSCVLFRLKWLCQRFTLKFMFMANV